MERRITRSNKYKTLLSSHQKVDNAIEREERNSRKQSELRSKERSEPPRKRPRLSANTNDQPRSLRSQPQSLKKDRTTRRQARNAARKQTVPPEDKQEDLLPGHTTFGVKVTSVDNEEPNVSPRSSAAQKDFKCQSPSRTKDKDLSHQKVGPVQQDHSPASDTRSDDSKRIFVKAWLSSTVNERPLDTLDSELEENMAPALQNRDETGTIVTASKSSAKSSVSAYDFNFGKHLSYRNIFVARERPPSTLLKKVEEILKELRSSPEIEKVSAQALTDTAQRLRRSAEEDIVHELGGPLLVPNISDQRVFSTRGQVWANLVPVPQRLKFTAHHLPLARPKPDRSFGYSDLAFTEDQLDSMDHLIDLTTRGSYAMPYDGLYFPFLSFEFKSQAKGGTILIGTDQAANAGAVVGHGLTELARRSSEWKSLDYNEPQFFSLVMDHMTAHINVHWLHHDAQKAQFSFHTHECSRYWLDDPDTMRIIQRSIKNILDWGLNRRLPMICKELDAYSEKMSREKAKAEKAASEKAAAEKAAFEKAVFEKAVAEASATRLSKTKRANKQGQKRKSLVQKRNGTAAVGVTVSPLNT